MTNESATVQSIMLTLIDRPAEPDRLSIDPEYLSELASSIAEIGLISPVVLCPRNGRYEIVAGDCRFQAVMSLGWLEIPAFIKDFDAESLSITRATENLQRRDLTIIEEARIYKTLHDEHNLSWDNIGKRTGKLPGMVKRRYHLLDLPEVLIKAMHEQGLSYAIAEELWRLKDLAKVEYYLGFILDHGATKTVVRDWVKNELLRERELLSAGGSDRGELTAYEEKPLYISCDGCHGPVEIKDVRHMRVCKACFQTIRKNL